MVDLSVERIKRTRVAQTFKRVALLRPKESARPLLSVVVPFHDSAPRLKNCLESLVAQTQSGIEVILVDDGSTDGSSEIAAGFVDRVPCFLLVRQTHAGVGAARNAGARRASGEYLAFCDSDDEVPPNGYERLLGALNDSGSDLAVGSVALQDKGLYREPRWAWRSNAARRLRAELEDVPEIMANLLPGTKVFRRSFWDANQLSFIENEDHSDIVTVVRAMLVAHTFDIIPAVVYRWAWREDGRSLFQRDLQEKERVRDRVASICQAGDLLVAEASEPVSRQFFAEILHTTIPDLVRAAVCRQDGYWEALSAETRRLVDMISPGTLKHVPVEDRIIAWLCARDEREAIEDFLEYAFDNRSGYPFREVDGRADIALPVIDALASVHDDLTRVADSDMRYRTRLSEMAWTSPGVLSIEGVAFVEYVDDTPARGEVTLLLTDRDSGHEICLPTRRISSPAVNRWANRAHEDHSRSAFAVDIETQSLPCGASGRADFSVSVRLLLDGVVREAPFQSRRAGGSTGLLEVVTLDGIDCVPTWRPLAGLGLRMRKARGDGRVDDVTGAPIVVETLSADDGVLELTGSATEDCELALVGPRSRTPWTRWLREGSGFRCRISVLIDEWGLGEATLPIDDYDVIARFPDGSQTPVTVDPGLWRNLPLFFGSGTYLFHPRVDSGGALTVRVTPGEFRESVGEYARRRLRDEAYPAAREEPLLEVAFFETFAGKAAGDNPGPLCEELSKRETGIDLVFSVFDRSVAVPDGARAVVRWSAEWFELMARARYLITNAPLPPFFRKRSGQVFVHTWHGTPLKRIAHDRKHQDFVNWHHRRQLLVARDDWDFLLSQSPFCTEALRSAFLYEGEMLELGYPRNDILTSAARADVRRRTREHFGLSDDTRVILYAPTWRDNQRAGKTFDKVLFLDPLAVVEQVPNSVVLVRGHYSSMGAAEEVSPDPRVLDVTRHPDISHLYLAADALITDYSSVFFDFVLTDKPMYFLAPDLAQYRDDNRGFYLDYHETVPGPVRITSQEVIDAINGPDEYAEVREQCRAEYAPLDDGHASQRVIDAVLRKGAPHA